MFDFKKKKNNKRLIDIFEKGKQMFEAETDIIKVIKNIRNMKIFLKFLGYDGLNKYIV